MFDGGLKYFLFSLLLFGEDSHFDSYFSDGLKRPRTSCFLHILDHAACIRKARMRAIPIQKPPPFQKRVRMGRLTGHVCWKCLPPLGCPRKLVNG